MTKQNKLELLTWLKLRLRVLTSTQLPNQQTVLLNVLLRTSGKNTLKIIKTNKMNKFTMQKAEM